MKLLYTSIVNDLTVLLTEVAQEYVTAGKRVFYIAPNSLSFEKERKVLEHLPQGASFAITVTRFGQMARYFVLNSVQDKETLDDAGLSMVIYKALASLPEEALKVYGRLKRDPNIIKQLADLYKELKKSQLTLHDLRHLDDQMKANDLMQILAAVETILAEGQFDNQTKLAFFADQVRTGALDNSLAETVLVIDGFTRFSAEEAALITLLHEKGAEIVIGTYASEKAYRSTFSYGNIYQASIDFLRELASTFGTKPVYIGEKSRDTAFARLSRLIEEGHDFTATGEQLSEADRQKVSIWEVASQKEEVTQVARDIRQLLATGARYKEILVLVGDVEAYQLQVGKIFDKFDIPYYFAKAESMAHHPLVNVIDALDRLKRYHYRSEDLFNLLKSGLFGHYSQMEIDRFEQYVRYADINGYTAFNREFTVNQTLAKSETAEEGQMRYRYDLEALNGMRQQIITALAYFLGAKKQKGTSLLAKFNHFLEQIQLPKKLSQLTVGASQLELEQHEQVWTVFTGLLHQMHTIFGEEKVTVEEFLALLRSGMMTADYRTVPATVDVVNVKSYDLVEPHSAKYVFAIGMTQSYFPKITENKTLISDQERSRINELSDDGARLDIASMENVKKNHFAALSLFNAATEKLILSVPQLLNESTDEMSTYLKELVALGVSVEEKKPSYQDHQIGHYKDVLATALAINRGELDRELTKEEQTFWSVAVRYLRRKLSEQQVLIPTILEDITVKPISSEVMTVKFPEEDPIRLSVSALTTFYNNEYLYFIRYVLGLEEQQTVRPDARVHGQYLHRIFERLLAEKPHSEDFDQRVDAAIAATATEQQFATLYQSADQEGQLSLSILEDIAKSTASFLQGLSIDQVESQEKKFQFTIADKAAVNGIIDRVDRLSDGSYGVVDYKSSETTFNLQAFYNGLNSQLVTYLKALVEQYGLASHQLFGAMYLHMQEPSVKLSEVKSQEQILLANQSKLIYQGIFSEEEKAHLADGNYKLGTNLYAPAQLETLLNYNDKLFSKAVDTIRSGRFAINPYTEDLKSVKGEQLRSITHFEADRHLITHARRLVKLPKKGNRIVKEEALAMMEGDEDVD